MPVSGSIQENNIAYVVDGQNRDYRGGFGGLSWMSELPAANNVVFIGNSNTIGKGPANKPLFYPAYNNSDANVIYAVNKLPGSPGNFTTIANAYNWATTNNYFINNSNTPIPRPNASNLISYVDANQPSSYPQTGTTWHNLIPGFVPNGTLQNGTSWIAPSGSLFFDGTDDYVSFGNIGTIGNNQTIEVWFNSNSVTSYKNVFDMNYSTYNPNTGNVGPRLEQTTGAGINIIWSGNTTNNGVYNYTPQVAILANKWYHSVFTLSSGNWNWYINGNLEHSGTSPQGYITTYGDINFGRGFVLDPSRYFSGLESSARIYSRAISTSDVKQNYFQSNIVQDGLVFMVDANNLVSYPKSGTAWYNLTGSYSASLINSPIFDQSNGGAISFDGTDEYASVQYNSALDITTAITVEAWVKYRSQGEIGGAGRTYSVISYKGYPWTWLLEDQGGQFNFRISTTSVSDSDIASNYYHGLNNWDHVVCTYDGATQAIYVNGVLKNSKSLTGTINTSATTIELGTYGSGDYSFNGWLANHRIYNRALSVGEIQQNYEATKYKFLGQNIVTNGLIMYWDTGNIDSYPTTGTTIYDLSGANNYGILVNGVSYTNQFGGGLDCDPTDEFIVCNNPLDTNYVSVELFYTRNSAAGNGDDIVVNKEGVWEIKDVGGSLEWAVMTNNQGWFWQPTGFTMSVGETAHIVLTYDGNTVKFYKNGSLYSYTYPSGGVLNTGAYPKFNSRGYGKFDIQYPGDRNMYIFRIYNRALTQSEVTQNYNAQKIRFGL
jgi:hypothetical protein